MSARGPLIDAIPHAIPASRPDAGVGPRAGDREAAWQTPLRREAVRRALGARLKRRCGGALAFLKAP